VWSAVYSPFGGAYTLSGSETLNARFPGQWFQLEAGLHYNWHRHYDPTLGRYTQPDPLGFVDGPNVFSYALSSPYRYVDKGGRFVQFVIPAIPELITMITTIGVWLTLPDPPPLPQPEPRKRGKKDPIRKEPFNPGRCENGKCNPCPEKECWEVEEPGHGGERHEHCIEWNQNPDTCMCYPTRTTRFMD